ncbi:hypothetical protein MMC31_006748 [Peltigera leucophlebia]|nr:hypothetical protein [Peltigera leucophlebia]
MLPLSPDSFYFKEGALDPSKTIIDVPFKKFSRRSQNLQLPEPYDFPSNPPFDDDKTSIRGHVSDNALAKVASLSSLRDQRFPLASLRYIQSEEILPSQACQRIMESADLRACTIPSAKSPNLEGILSSQIPPPLETPSGIPLLKRKAKFTSSLPGTLRLRNQQGPSCPGGACSRCFLTAQPLCYSRQEFTHSRDWTPEHIMPQALQARVNVAFAPPLAPQTTRLLPSPTSSFSEEEQLLRNPGYPKLGNNEQIKPAIPQPSTWQNFVGSNDNMSFTTCSTEARSGWPLDSSFYGSKHGSYTATGHTGTTEEFADNGIMIQDYSYYGAMNDDSINSYFLETTRQFQSIKPETYSPTFSPATQTYPSSPPPSPLCPSLPSVSKSSSKHRKSGRRKSSVGMLRSSNPFGFVNYTPGDSLKILAGVAPSGSSKTKARREQEAQEKKKKLSLAAEKVIKEAGGDVEQLRASGLLM